MLVPPDGDKAMTLCEAMKHEKTTLRALVDFDPVLHQAVCECGYVTRQESDFGKVLTAINEHRDKARKP